MTTNFLGVIQTLVKAVDPALNEGPKHPRVERFNVLGKKYNPMTLKGAHSFLYLLNVVGHPAKDLLREFNPECDESGTQLVAKVADFVAEVYAAGRCANETRYLVHLFDIEQLLPAKAYWANKSEDELGELHAVNTEIAAATADCPPRWFEAHPNKENPPQNLALAPGLDSGRLKPRTKRANKAGNQAKTNRDEICREAVRLKAIENASAIRSSVALDPKACVQWAAEHDSIAEIEMWQGSLASLRHVARTALKVLAKAVKCSKQSKTACKLIDSVVSAGFNVEVAVVTVAGLYYSFDSAERKAQIVNVIKPSRLIKGYRILRHPLDPDAMETVFARDTIRFEWLRDAFWSLTDEFKGLVRPLAA
ncbi:MAG: hypothetical protein K8I27_12745 [Planctomycetes bacterium]|nr:hypothetical protein [Planctomycetota bacterium]